MVAQELLQSTAQSGRSEVEWQSDAAFAEVEPRMLEIERLARGYEVPLLDALEEEYGERIAQRGWMLCGPSSIVLGHLMSEDTGLPLVPFGPDRSKECLQLEMYVFNAFDDPRLGRKVDHTNLQYHTGTGFSLTIDPVYQLLWRNYVKGPGAMLVEWHYDHFLRDDMQTFFNLQMVRNLSVSRRPDLWGMNVAGHLPGPA